MLTAKFRDFGFLAVSAGGANPAGNVPPDCWFYCFGNIFASIVDHGNQKPASFAKKINQNSSIKFWKFPFNSPTP